MPVDWEVYKKAFDAADQNTKDLMSSSVIYDLIVAQLGEKVETVATSSVVLLIGYHLLGIKNQEKTLAELSELGVPDVYNFLNKILKEITTRDTVLTTQTTSEVLLVDLTNELEETERNLASIPGVHTMAQDMQAAQMHTEPVYQSSQSEILNRPAAVVPPPPAPPQTNIPRWDTE